MNTDNVIGRMAITFDTFLDHRLSLTTKGLLATIRAVKPGVSFCANDLKGFAEEEVVASSVSELINNGYFK